MRLRIGSIAFLLGALSVGVSWFTLQLPLATLLDALKKSGGTESAHLATRVQTTRETASRAVSALERRGVVRRDAEGLVIVARHRLEDLVV